MVDTGLLTIVIAAFGLYAVLGGADFGAGIWEVNQRFRASRDDKKLIYRAIGPVWEANHVWLIFGITAVWTCYPDVFRQLCIVVSFPLAIALAGIVFRGASYAFRSSGMPGKQNWEAVFAIASTVTPFFFGCIVGVLSDDRYALADPEKRSLSTDLLQLRSPLTEWLGIPELFFGFFAVGICSFLASVFLAREAASMEQVQFQRWRNRALLMSVLVGGFSLAGLWVTRTHCQTIWTALIRDAWHLTGLGILAGVAALFSIQQYRLRLATVFSSAAVVLVLIAWCVAQVQSGHHFGIQYNGPDPATANVRTILFAGMVAGVALITPPMIWLFRIFKAEQEGRR